MVKWYVTDHILILMNDNVKCYIYERILKGMVHISSVLLYLAILVWPHFL